MRRAKASSLSSLARIVHGRKRLELFRVVRFPAPNSHPSCRRIFSSEYSLPKSELLWSKLTTNLIATGARFLSTTTNATGSESNMGHSQDKDGSGKYAGFLAEFSITDGSLLPVPSRLVPDELIMWGQAPTTLETLVSEQTIDTGAGLSSEGDSDTSLLLFRRRTITVLPAVGCALDSLDTNRSEEIYSINNDCEQKSNDILLAWKDETNGVGVMDALKATTATTTDADDSTVTRKIRLETTFRLPGDHRLRISFALNVVCCKNGTCRYELPLSSSSSSSLSSSSSIRVQWERRYDNDTYPESQTLAANIDDRNGHLDAGTVFSLIGEDLRRRRSQLASLTQKTPTNTTTNKDDAGGTHSRIDLHLVESLRISSSCSVDDAGTDDENFGHCWHLDVGLGLPTIDSQPGGPNINETIRTVRRTFREWHCTPSYFENGCQQTASAFE